VSRSRTQSIGCGQWTLPACFYRCNRLRRSPIVTLSGWAKYSTKLESSGILWTERCLSLDESGKSDRYQPPRFFYDLWFSVSCVSLVECRTASDYKILHLYIAFLMNKLASWLPTFADHSRIGTFVMCAGTWWHSWRIPKRLWAVSSTWTSGALRAGRSGCYIKAASSQARRIMYWI
jgi:hypothetical protein